MFEGKTSSSYVSLKTGTNMRVLEEKILKLDMFFILWELGLYELFSYYSATSKKEIFNRYHLNGYSDAFKKSKNQYSVSVFDLVVDYSMNNLQQLNKWLIIF